MTLRKTLLTTLLFTLLVAAAGPVFARFLSPDPAPADQENFNRYWYANDNPYTFVDPDGRYTCPSNGSECNTFDQAIESARTASESSRLTAAQQIALRDSANFFGQKGDPNVEVRFADLQGDYGRINTNTEGKGSVTFDLQAIAGKNPGEDGLVKGLAMRILHEGDHGTRTTRNGYTTTRAERLELERNGYRAEAYYQKAMEFLQNGGNMWAPWSAGDGFDNGMIDSRENRSVEAACLGYSEGNCR